jgi:hypothetical protein
LIKINQNPIGTHHIRQQQQQQGKQQFFRNNDNVQVAGTVSGSGWLTRVQRLISASTEFDRHTPPLFSNLSRCQKKEPNLFSK